MSRSIAVRNRPHVAPSMVESVFSGIFEQGVGNQTFKVVNIILLGLFGSIFFMFFNGMGSIHTYILLFLAGGLAVSLNWFRSALISNKPTTNDSEEVDEKDQLKEDSNEQSNNQSIKQSPKQSNKKSLAVPADDSDDDEFRPRRPLTRSQSRGRESINQSTNQSTNQNETSGKKTRRSRKE